MRARRLLWAGSLLLAMCWLAGPRPAAAEEAKTTAAHEKVCPICGRIRGDDESYTTKAGATLTRGATNTVFGWTELIRQPAAEVKAGGNVFTGIGKGASEAIRRTFGGLGEVLTFWTPKVNKHYLVFSTDCPICMKSASGSSQQPAPSTKH